MALQVHGMVPLVQVFDMPTAVHFYRDILGFAVVTDSGNDDHSDWVWLRLGEIDLMLNTAYESDSRPSKPDPARVHAHSDTSLFFGCDDPDAAYEYFKTHRVEVTEPTDQ